ncbi:MAG: alpha-(1-_3)-arabinofuranosyltransferase family protein, partial [Aeromicrobium sp.]
MTSALLRPRSSRLHLLIVSAVVALVPWYVIPGQTVTDTKIDLVVDPWSYLGRSLSAWDPEAFFGQLQNQAYGYLFPMGPFFGVTRSLGIPEWACQRMWWSLLLVVGFVGAYLLVRRWGIAGHRVALLAAVVYALSPRVLTVLGSISAEAWPAALVPWLLLGADRLLRAGSRAERRRAAACLGLLVVAIGGVNATATIAALAVPTIYLVAAGRGGVRAVAWWAGAVIVATAWWTVPLVVLGRYAYPFLDFIESSATTTRFMSIPNILRGTSHWIAYVPFGSSGEWPAGALLATSGWLILATTAVAVLGLVGLMLRPSPQQHDAARQGHIHRFAVLSTLVGVTIMGIGFG